MVAACAHVQHAVLRENDQYMTAEQEPPAPSPYPELWSKQIMFQRVVPGIKLLRTRLAMPSVDGISTGHRTGAGSH